MQVIKSPPLPASPLTGDKFLVLKQGGQYPKKNPGQNFSKIQKPSIYIYEVDPNHRISSQALQKELLILESAITLIPQIQFQ